MFEAAEVGHVLDKKTFERELPALREALLSAQSEVLKSRAFPVLVIVAGVEASGKGDAVSALTDWLDPRHVQVHALNEPTDEERERPPMWRFWRRLPPKGKIGVFFSSWYNDAIVDRALGKSGATKFNDVLAEVKKFETMLSNEGTLIIKFWLHISKKAQRRRLSEFWEHKKTRYRVSPEDWKRLERYDEFRAASEHALRETSTPDAPWVVLEAEDARYRNFSMAKALLDAMQGRLAPAQETTKNAQAPLDTLPQVAQIPLVRTLDLTQRIDKDAYEKLLEKHHRRLALLTLKRRFSKISPVLVFEGMDAAGKGGTIRRVTRALDPRLYDVHPTAAPSEEERSQPYLWRFWRHAPRDGKFAIFDRSWYGRVLVERVENLVEPPTWARAYGEINDFEEQLVRAGNVVVKFWLQITKEEQLRRFEEREKVSFKRFKITDEDWRNREKWELYERAASDMIEHTSTGYAPWTLVEAEDKYFARLKVLETVCDALERAL